ncbi:MAG: hypothetical protein KKA41_13095 [Proteobacteria bacterium]|nr:hypothetical protein [Pseudomonadota bacterium]
MDQAKEVIRRADTRSAPTVNASESADTRSALTVVVLKWTDTRAGLL